VPSADAEKIFALVSGPASARRRDHMKPDFGEAIARGIVDGVVGLLTQPIVMITLVLIIGISILTRRRRRR
jgi:hypothetical protein